MGHKDDPGEEQAPGNGRKGGIDGCMRGIIHVVDVTHGSRSQERGQHTHSGHQPAQAKLHPTQLGILIFPQNIAQQDAHDVNSRAMGREGVHVVGSAEQALDAGRDLRFKKDSIDHQTSPLTWCQSRCSWTAD